MNKPIPIIISRRQLLALPVALAWPGVPLGERPAGRIFRIADKSSKERMLTQERPSVVTSLASATVVKDENLFFLTEPDGTIR